MKLAVTGNLFNIFFICFGFVKNYTLLRHLTWLYKLLRSTLLLKIVCILKNVIFKIFIQASCITIRCTNIVALVVAKVIKFGVKITVKLKFIIKTKTLLQIKFSTKLEKQSLSI